MSDPDSPAETSPTVPPPPSADAKTRELRAASVPDAETLSPASGSDAATLSLASDLLGPLPSAGRMFGRYRLTAEIGHGAMGVVWKAHDTRLDRDVALKQIRTGALADAPEVERFEREARLAARLVHPGIVAVHDVGVEAGSHYFTSDYVPSRSLEVVMRGAVSIDQAVSWTKAVAEALHHAHQLGVIHRDVKPANVLIDDAGRPHLTDFGLAKEVSLSAVSTLTADGTLLGSPAYMSPEQAAMKTEVIGPASDQFSLGVVLYEMICRARPFRGDSLRDLLDAIAEREPARPTTIDRRIPADVETVCLKALEKDPGARYASMSELAEDLGRCLAGEPVHARPIGSIVRVLRRAHKRPGVLALAVLAVVSGAYAVVSQHLHERETEENARLSAAAEQAAFLKGEKVAQVLLRWAELRPAFDEMEGVRTDVTLREAERRAALARLHGPIEAFARATPADATSQSAMKALVAWADHLCGRASEAEAGLGEAASLDPDLPYAALVQAMRRAVPYLSSQPFPPLLVGPEVLEMAGPEAESPERRALRVDAQAWLARAGAARVWGKGLAQDFRKAIDAMSGACEGRYEESERLLTELLDRARMPAFEVELRYARARVRFLLKRPVDALADLDAVCAARPRSEEPLSFRAMVGMGSAAQKTARGEDARAEFDEALASSDAGITLLRDARDPATLAMALGHRASIRFMRAQSVPGEDSEDDLRRCDKDLREARALAPPDAERWVVQATVAMKLGERARLRGKDPRDWFRDSLEACDRALGLSPENPSARLLRAIVRRDRGAWRAEQGEDPREDLSLALREFDAIDAKAPTDSESLLQRARLRSIQGQYAKLAGVDAGRAFELGVADLDRALAGGERADLLLERATLLAQRGQWEAGAGGDPRPWYARAVVDSDAAVGRAPTASAFYRRAISRTVLGEWLSNQGFDPRADLRGAVADYGEATRLDPGDGTAWDDLAKVRWCLGEFAEQARAIERALALPGTDTKDLEGRLATARKDIQTLDECGLPPWAYRTGYALQAIARKDYAAARWDLMKARAWMTPEHETMRVNEYGYADMLFDLACLSGMESEGKLERKPVDPRRAAWLLEAGFANLDAALESGYANAEKLRSDPDLSALRSDPRWADIERRLPK